MQVIVKLKHVVRATVKHIFVDNVVDVCERGRWVLKLKQVWCCVTSAASTYGYSKHKY
jgi:hypothetical protein